MNFCNAMTVDVEDYFQVTGFAGRVSRRNWDHYECRVETNTNRLLSLLDEVHVRGTFFVLGWVAERYPALIRRIAKAGHEIASHGYWHQLVYELTPEEFVADISNSRDAIANACGVQVHAYRAPSFSIVRDSLWALDLLAEQGFTIDSSIFPIGGHDRYGIPDARQEIHDLATPHGSICEFPPSAWSRPPLHLPIGGGYFRLFPLRLTTAAINGVRREGRPAMFYIHPWELDIEQPRFNSVSRRARFRHYVGLQHTERRLRRLCQTQPFDTLSAVINSVRKRNIPATAPCPETASVCQSLTSHCPPLAV